MFLTWITMITDNFTLEENNIGTLVLFEGIYFEPISIKLFGWKKRIILKEGLGLRRLYQCFLKLFGGSLIEYTLV